MYVENFEYNVQEYPAKPDVPGLTLQQWKVACALNDMVQVFKGVHDDLSKTPCWIQLGEQLVCLFNLLYYF